MTDDDGGRLHTAIVGVNGRPAGRDAIALARLLVAPDGSLSLAHVHAGDLRPSRTSRVPLGGVAGDESLTLLEAERATSGVEAELLSVAASSVGRGLHELAREHDADVLVVGSCARGVSGRVLLGNDTRAALSGAPCAVAVAPLGFAGEAHAIETIGVGYDGSPESERALALARGLATAHGATLRAREVVRMPTSPLAGFAAETWNDELEELLHAGATEQLMAVPGVEAEAVLGLPAEELAAFGGEVDLLVVGSRGYGPARRLMFGSTAAHLCDRAPCPLLVLPRSAQDERSA